ncbi:Transcription factor spt20 [Aspergillus hancockii]|nr:Transcription factor spt20 [Aspergillus hancockii]
MATAISKPTSHPPKMKRPPPPFVPAGVNGVKTQQSSSSPQPASKCLPPSNQPGSAGSTTGVVTNGVNGAADSNGVKGPINRPKKDAQKLGDSGARLTKPLARTSSTDNERRLGKKCPEPYVKTPSYILKKYAKCPPSLVLHLHPTHFRFEQQDGSFPYNSEMKVIIEHIRAGTVPHDMMEELLRANVRFYEGCLIVRVVDHKSVSAQVRKSTTPSTNDSNTPFSIHNYNEHITPSAYVPYPKQNQLTSEKAKDTGGTPVDAKTNGEQSGDSQDQTEKSQSSSTQHKPPAPKPRVFTTVLHPTSRSLQAELTLLATTPDPKAAKQGATNTASRTQATSSAAPPSPGVSSNQPERGHVAKRQKMLVEPQDLPECEAKLTRALAPPLFLEPVGSLDAVQDLLKFMESPLNNDPPPSPKRRKRTVAELAADEALAAEEERFMLIMDERLEPTTSGGAGGTKAAVVDDTSGSAPFEPRFSRFKTLENIRMQHEEKAKREHEIKLKQELAKRQQQEQERERRRALEQRQAEEQAKEDSRRQHLAAQQQVQAQLAAQQQGRHVMAQPNGVSQGPQSSPVVRNQTPHNTSSPVVGNAMSAQGGVPMSMTSSMQGAGSPPRPPSALQHAHPNVMGHPMAPSRSQQGQSRHGTPQMTQGTPAMSHATPIMRNVTPTQRMSHASPGRSTVAPTPVMNQAMMGTPQMANGMNLTPQQQQMLLQQRQQMLAQQGHLGQHGQLTPQQFAQFQATAHAQQNIQSQQQQQMLQAQQQNQQQQQQQQNIPNPQVYQQQLMRAQFAQMQMAQQQRSQGQQSQGQQGQMHQGGTQMNPQQQQMLMAAAQANGGQLPQNLQGVNMAQGAMAQRYNQLYQQRLLRLRQEMASRLMPQYGPPNQYPPPIAQQYGAGLERNAKAWVHEIIRRERDAAQQQRANQVAAVQAQVMQQQQQQNMMQNGMSS